MTRKGQYHTRQMAELVELMRSVRGRHVTVSEICEHFKSRGITVGTTTVYRHLEKMVREGAVAKYVVDCTSAACFEYIEGDGECREPVCFHCKCEGCGRLIHLECDELVGISSHLKADHGFALDSHRTVFYGLCGECQRSEGVRI